MTHDHCVAALATAPAAIGGLLAVAAGQLTGAVLDIADDTRPSGGVFMPWCFYLVRDAVLSITNIRSRIDDRYHKSKKEARKTACALHVKRG